MWLVSDSLANVYIKNTTLLLLVKLAFLANANERKNRWVVSPLSFFCIVTATDITHINHFLIQKRSIYADIDWHLQLLSFILIILRFFAYTTSEKNLLSFRKQIQMENQ